MLDALVVVVYLVAVAWLGIRLAGRQSGAGEYFLGNRELPWWAVCFSIVATETSTLTVIGVPAIAYGGSLAFLQLALGYMVGRVIVAWLLLPRYYAGELNTAYAMLGGVFGRGMRGTASVTFLITRLLADGVRLFATAIPIQIMLSAFGWDVAYFPIILAISITTAIYTLIGGIKAVVWTDVVQMCLYLLGGVYGLWLAARLAGPGWFAEAVAAGKTGALEFRIDEGFAAVVTSPYAFVVALVGGAAFSMASHGADQLIVQRLLACRDLRDSQRALIGSGVVVFVQFAMFLMLGLALWAHYDGAAPDAIGAGRADAIFPLFILQEMPAGLRGLLIVGIVAAAMSTLSSSLNSLASSTLFDLYEQFTGRRVEGERALGLSRLLTMIWAGVFVVFASLFTSTEHPVVELGLGIAGFTYGALLGAFLLAIWLPRTPQSAAIAAFALTVACMVFVIFGIWHGANGWVVAFRPDAEAVAAYGLKPIAWPLYAPIGAALTVGFGGLFGARSRLGGAVSRNDGM